MGFGNIGLPGALIILLIVLVLFGPNKLPQLGEGIGKMLRGFRKELKAHEDEREADAAARVENQLPKSAAAEGETIDVTPKSGTSETDRTARIG